MGPKYYEGKRLSQVLRSRGIRGVIVAPAEEPGMPIDVKFGLRQMVWTVGAYKNLVIYSVKNTD
ncbi:MAG: hypothetical protein ACK5NG_08245 [Chthoniobacterales bacterium]